MARGGNLILGGHDFNKATIGNNVGNQLLRAAKLGVFISSAKVNPDHLDYNLTFGTEPPSRFTHASYALDALARATDLNATARDEASVVVKKAAHVLPLRMYPEYLARLQAFVNDLTISPSSDTPFDAVADPVGKQVLKIEAFVLDRMPASEAHRSD